MTRTLARILLCTFVFSVSIFSLFETGHQILHSFKNPFHDHDGTHHKVYRHNHAPTHTLADHHWKKSNLPNEMKEESQEGQSLISLLLGIFKSSDKIEVTLVGKDLSHHTLLVGFYSSLGFSPPTPPPLPTQSL